MKNIILKYSLLISVLILSGMLTISAQTLIDIETGMVTTGYNDVRIPGDQGTLFSLKDDLKTEGKIFYRLRLSYTLNDRHTFSALYAPLKTSSEGRLSDDLNFEGVIFPSNTDLTGSYKFNSYRLTYRYEILRKEKIDFGFGFTAKIRDAEILISSAGSESKKTNVGFVPILNFRLLWKPAEKFNILFEGDALAAPQGRAEDVLLAGAYRISDRLTFKAGYRLLEGGADNDEVYSFALFHYASAGFSIQL